MFNQDECPLGIERGVINTTHTTKWVQTLGNSQLMTAQIWHRFGEVHSGFHRAAFFSPPPEPSTHRALCRRWTATWAHLCARAQSISYQCPSGRSPARPSLLMTTRRSPFYLLFFNSKFSIALARPFALTSAAVRTGGPDVLCPHRCALCVKYEQARNEVQTAIMLLSAQWHICIYWERETRGGSEWKKKKKPFSHRETHFTDMQAGK